MVSYPGKPVYDQTRVENDAKQASKQTNKQTKTKKKQAVATLEECHSMNYLIWMFGYKCSFSKKEPNQTITHQRFFFKT